MQFRGFLMPSVHWHWLKRIWRSSTWSNCFLDTTDLLSRPRPSSACHFVFLLSQVPVCASNDVCSRLHPLAGASTYGQPNFANDLDLNLIVSHLNSNCRLPWEMLQFLFLGRPLTKNGPVVLGATLLLYNQKLKPFYKNKHHDMKVA